MLYAIAVVLLVALDQGVKFLVRANIDLYQSIPFIPYLLNLTYYQNTGAAFSSLSQHTWVLTLISAVMSVVLAVVLVKRVVKHPLGRWPLAVVLAGAIGNLIDRVAFGYVTDMFQTTFINFAIFNVADICIVVGGIAFAVYFIFGWERFEKQGEKEEAHDGADAEG